MNTAMSLFVFEKHLHVPYHIAAQGVSEETVENDLLKFVCSVLWQRHEEVNSWK